MNFLFKFVPFATTGFLLWLLWVLLQRNRLDIRTRYLAASGDYFQDPFFSMQHYRDITSLVMTQHKHHKVIYLPCMYMKARVIIKTGDRDYYKTYRSQYVILKF